MNAAELASNYNELFRQDAEANSADFGGSGVGEMKVQQEEHLRKKGFERQQDESRKRKAEADEAEEDEKPKYESRAVGFALLLGTFRRTKTQNASAASSSRSQPAQSNTTPRTAASANTSSKVTTSGKRAAKQSDPSGTSPIGKIPKTSGKTMSSQEFDKLRVGLQAAVDQVQPALDAFAQSFQTLHLHECTALLNGLKTQIACLKGCSSKYPDCFSYIQLATGAMECLQPAQAFLRFKLRKGNHPVYYPELSPVMATLRLKSMRIPADALLWEILPLVQHLIRMGDHNGHG